MDFADKAESKCVWTIHGKKYDLRPFIARHPGGAQILHRALLMKDCGAIFETYHAFSNKSLIKSSLEQYRVNDKADSSVASELDPPVYNYEDYDELVHRIKKLYPNRESIKAPVSFYVKNLICFFIYLLAFYQSMFSQYNVLVRSILSFFSGFLWMSLGFNLMHDGSHYAISTSPYVNQILESAWCSFGLWNSLIWNIHHVYAHHSFTSNTKFDPDLRHFRPFVRKYRKDRTVKQIFYEIQEKLIVFVGMVVPGMYLGQVIAYIVGMIRSKIWGVDLPSKFQNFFKPYEFFLYILSIYCLWNGLFFPTVSYLAALNIFYHLNIIGDHDTFESSVVNRDESTNNWLKIQICHSADFMTENPFWTQLFGGINFQIEHHLFPNMSHMHYSYIKPIVTRFCLEKGFPYETHDTLWETYSSFLKNIKYQAGF